MLLCRCSWLSDTIEHEFGKMRTHLFAKNSNRGKWGIEFDSVDVVAAYYGYLVRNPNVKIAQRVVHTLGARVRAGKDRSRRFSTCEYGFGQRERLWTS